MKFAVCSIHGDVIQSGFTKTGAIAYAQLLADSEGTSFAVEPESKQGHPGIIVRPRGRASLSGWDTRTRS